jgi:heat shock protein HslJ
MSRPSNMRYAVRGILLALLLAAAGCGARGEPAEPGAQPDPLRGRTFTTQDIEIRFTDDGRLVANAGCNIISGPVALDGGRVDAADLSVTERGCDPQLHAQDEQLSAFLAAKPSWRLDGERLTLSAAGTELAFTEEKARPLVGTTWKADTIIQGEVAGATPAAVTATLVFGQDKVTVTGLCNLREVEYHATGTTITFELGMMTLMACDPEIMTVEQAATAVMDGEAGYRIDTNTLTITKGDKGLRFTAR